MFQFLNYNFFKDEDCLTPVSTNTQDLTNTTIQNSIFDHFNQTKDISAASESSTPPTVWDYLTIMDANFNGNISAGNASDLFANVTAIKVKRRKLGEFNWITLKTIPITDPNNIAITFNDNLVCNFTEYEYAFVPITQGIEGNYISKTIEAQFNGVFICDQNTIFKFIAEPGYGNMEQVQKIGVFEPFGKQYPVVVSNGVINYKSSSFSALVATDDIDMTNRKGMVEKREQLLKYFTNHKSKIIKDWNGNCFLMLVTSSPNITFDNNYGMGKMNIGFDWREVGDVDSQADLVNTGMVSG